VQETDEEFDRNEEVDSVLREYLSTPTWNDSYDLISGLVGLGVYAADRLPRTVARECLELIVDHLDKLARPMNPGVTWWVPPERLKPSAREEHPQGYANLGVAHGVPGAIVLLARACAEGVATEKASRLLSGSLEWFLAQKFPSTSESLYGDVYSPTSEKRPSRSAWCYGDPGVAAALFCAAHWTSDSRLQREAHEIGLHAVRRSPATAGVVDAPLCHGAAGLGHLYNRMYQATGETAYLAGARAWFSRALEMRQTDEGIGGYSSWRQNAWTSDWGLLAGATGIGLAFLAAATSIEPDWDRLMLASIPVIDF
jgi:lantibiotic modifying enzyme